jgi:phytanoyl-CoA hydroxylase
MMDWKQDAEQIKGDFNRNGFIILRQYMSAAEVSEVGDNIERYVTDVLPGLPGDDAYYEVKGDAATIMRLSRMTDHDRYFRDLYGSDPFFGLAGHLLGGARESMLQWFNKPPRVGKVTPPHQDGFYFMLEPNEALTLWLAIDAADEENGCIRYVAGSHRRGMRPHRRSEVLGFSQGITDFGDDDHAEEVAIVVEPGDLIAHHSMIIHRADANPSDRSRSALGMVYYAERAVEDLEKREAYQQQLWAQWQAEGKL